MTDKEYSILIIDDEKINLYLTKRIIESFLSNTKIDITTSAESAIDSIRENNYDVIIIDYRLQTIKGTRLAKIIRENINYKSYIVGFTAESNLKIDYECFESGMNYVIHKPLDFIHFKKLMKIYMRNLSGIDVLIELGEINYKYISNVVSSKAELVHLIDTFIEEHDSDFRLLETYINDNKSEMLLDIVHSIKGTSANLGLESIASSASDLYNLLIKYESGSHIREYIYNLIVAYYKIKNTYKKT